MSDRLRLALLDDEIERVAALSGSAQRMAACALVAVQLGQRGVSLAGLQAVSLEGRDLSLRMVRDAGGDLQVESIVRAKDGGRWE